MTSYIHNGYYKSFELYEEKFKYQLRKIMISILKIIPFYIY